MKKIDPKKVQGVQRHDNDSGSPEVQIALLSHEIETQQQHLSAHKKDVDAKRSLLKKVARRRKLVNDLKKTNLERYMAVSKKLGLKDAS